MFGFSGAAISKLRNMQNGGKRARHSIDAWDRQSMCLSFQFIFAEKRNIRAKAIGEGEENISMTLVDG